MTAAVAVEDVTLTLGAFCLQNLDFALAAGEILVLLGPNGSGKSVTLETIAGFHRPDRGRILIGGRDVTELPPERRSTGFVVQNFGLFPHLTVAQNVAIARRSGRTVHASDSAFPPHGDLGALLAYFGIAHLAARTPEDLSPGEKQRAALARALAGAPQVFLFDEPFSALDFQTREKLRDELLAYLRKLAIPALFVTHDHTEAMTLADRIVVLRAGAVMQSGPAAEVFHKPANFFVARFVGIENVLSARIVEIAGGYARLAVGDRTLRARMPAGFGALDQATMSIRAENVRLRTHSALPSPAAVNRLEGRVAGLRAAGPLVTVEIDCGFALKALLLAPHATEMALHYGSAVNVEIAPEAIHLMTEDTGASTEKCAEASG